MMTTQNVNYTPDQVTQLVTDYNAGTPVEALAEALGKSVKSVVAKLSREGVYKPKTKATSGSRVTKADMTKEAETILDLPEGALDSLQKGTHEALEMLVVALRSA